MSDLPDTLTAAQNRNGVVIMRLHMERTDTNVRSVPYAERFRQYSGLFESPVERLQRTVEESEQQQDDQ